MLFSKSKYSLRACDAVIDFVISYLLEAMSVEDVMRMTPGLRHIASDFKVQQAQAALGLLIEYQPPEWHPDWHPSAKCPYRLFLPSNHA